jgi:hypothetical protein
MSASVSSPSSRRRIASRLWCGVRRHVAAIVKGRFGSKPVIRLATRERPFLAQLGRHGEEVIPQIMRRRFRRWKLTAYGPTPRMRLTVPKLDKRMRGQF